MQPKTAKRTGKKNASKTSQSVVTAESNGPIDRLALVRSMIHKCSGARDNEKSSKPMVAELIRLLVLEKELSDEHQVIQEIRVKWVEPTETE